MIPGNIDDREPVSNLFKNLFGKVTADRGYASQPLSERLLSQMGIQLIVLPRKNMQNRLMPLMDKILMRKCSIIETIIDQFKNISQIEHSRHRSPVNFFVNMVCGLIVPIVINQRSLLCRLKSIDSRLLNPNSGYG